MKCSEVVVAALAALLLCSAAPAAGSSSRRLAAAPPAPEQNATGDCCARLAAIGFKSELPVVIVDSAGQGIPHHVDTPVQLCTCNSGQPFKDYSGPAIAAGRGTSSANFTKKSYAVELQNATGGSENFPFLGMPKESDWILYGGDEVDLTQGMRDFMAYNLARASGQYATRTVYIEVFLVNDSRPLAPNHYNGIYIGEEKVKVDKDRVNISKLDPADPSGGWIILYDNDNIVEGDTTVGPAANFDHPFVVKYPKDPTADQEAWLMRYINSFQEALYAQDWLTRTPSYTSLIDGPAFVDYMLLVELTKNPDGYRGSTFMHKDRGGPLAMGPAWDYNEAMGECCGYPLEGWENAGASGPGIAGGSAISPEGWRFLICADPGRCLVEAKDGTSVWYRRMWQDPQFRSAAIMRWQELRAGPWSDASITKLMEDTAAQIKPAVLRNYARYMWVLMQPGFSSAEEQWTSEVDQLQSWLLKRVNWMDGALTEAAATASAAAAAPNAEAIATAGRAALASMPTSAAGR